MASLTRYQISEISRMRMLHDGLQHAGIVPCLTRGGPSLAAQRCAVLHSHACPGSAICLATTMAEATSTFTTPLITFPLDGPPSGPVVPCPGLPDITARQPRDQYRLDQPLRPRQNDSVRRTTRSMSWNVMMRSRPLLELL